MAKRYHQTKKDRMHERHGERMHMMHERRAREHESAGMRHKMHHSESERREHHMREDGMLHNDPRETANMPQHPIFHGYERIQGFLPDSIDDSRHEIERHIKETEVMSRRQYAPKHWA